MRLPDTYLVYSYIHICIDLLISFSFVVCLLLCTFLIEYFHLLTTFASYFWCNCATLPAVRHCYICGQSWVFVLYSTHEFHFVVRGVRGKLLNLNQKFTLHADEFLVD